MGIDENEVARVRRMLGEARGRGRRVFSKQAKDAAAALASRAKTSGTSLARLAQQLGLHPMTLSAWARGAPVFALARVVDDPPTGAGPVVHASSGLRVEGLSVAQLAELLGRLRCSG